MRTPRGDLEQELQDPEYARLYGAASAKSEFAVALARARKELDLLRTELGEKVGREGYLGARYIKRLESGEANPRVGDIGSLFAAMGLRLVIGTAPLKGE